MRSVGRFQNRLLHLCYSKCAASRLAALYYRFIFYERPSAKLPISIFAEIVIILRFASLPASLPEHGVICPEGKRVLRNTLMHTACLGRSGGTFLQGCDTCFGVSPL